MADRRIYEDIVMNPLDVQLIPTGPLNIRQDDYEDLSFFEKARLRRGFDPLTLSSAAMQSGLTPNQTMGLVDDVADEMGVRLRGNARQSDYFPYFYGAGANLPTKFYQFGEAAGRGDVGSAVLGGLSSALGATRTFLGGYGYGKRNKYLEGWYRNKQYRDRLKDYQAGRQYMDDNGRGGTTMGFEFGGEFGDYLPMSKEDFEALDFARYSLANRNMFEDGGEALDANIPDIPMDDIPQEGVEQIAMNEQMMGGNEEAMIQQLMGQIVQYLQQGIDPNQIAQELIASGFSEEDVMMLIQEAMMYLQEGAQAQGLDSNIPNFEDSPENEDGMPVIDEVQDDLEQMRGGGSFKYKVGDYVKFEKGGKVVEGRIRKIDAQRGKFYL